MLTAGGVVALVEWDSDTATTPLRCSGRAAHRRGPPRLDRRSRAAGSRGRRRPRVAARCPPHAGHSYGPVAVIHDGDTPARGSLRPIALAVGAALGDELAISIYPDGRGADVWVVRPPTADRQGEPRVTDHQLEAALDTIEQAADAAVKAAAAALGEMKKAKSAAATGQMRALRQSLDNAVRLAEAASATARDLRDELDVRRAGPLRLRAPTPRRCWRWPPSRASMPSSPTTASSAIRRSSPCRRRTRRADRQEAGQAGAPVSARARPPVRCRRDHRSSSPRRSSRHWPTAYDLVVASKRGQPGTTVKLADVYNVLTVMPGAARDDSRQSSPATSTCSIRAASRRRRTAARSGCRPAPSPEVPGRCAPSPASGQEKVYAGLAFEGGRR